MMQMIYTSHVLPNNLYCLFPCNALMQLCQLFDKGGKVFY